MLCARNNHENTICSNLPIPLPCLLYSIVVLLSLVAHGLPLACADEDVSSPKKYHSPQEIAFSPDGSLLAVTDRLRGALVLIDVDASSGSQHSATVRRNGRRGLEPKRPVRVRDGIHSRQRCRGKCHGWSRHATTGR